MCGRVRLFLLINSVIKKIQNELLLERDTDVCSITETGLSRGEHDSIIFGQLSPDGYKLLDVSHAKGRVGGVALIYKKSLTVKQQKVVSTTSFECMEVNITAGNEVVRLAIVYRSPSGSKSGQPASVFLDEFYP